MGRKLMGAQKAYTAVRDRKGCSNCVETFAMIIRYIKATTNENFNSGAQVNEQITTNLFTYAAY